MRGRPLSLTEAGVVPGEPPSTPGTLRGSSHRASKPPQLVARACDSHFTDGGASSGGWSDLANQGHREFATRRSRPPPAPAPLSARVTAARVRPRPHTAVRPRPPSPRAPWEPGGPHRDPRPLRPGPRPPAPRPGPATPAGADPFLTRNLPAARSARAGFLCACALPPPRPGAPGTEQNAEVDYSPGREGR